LTPQAAATWHCLSHHCHASDQEFRLQQDHGNGQNGQLNRQQLRGLVIYQLNRHQRLHAQLFPISANWNPVPLDEIL